MIDPNAPRRPDEVPDATPIAEEDGAAGPMIDQVDEGRPATGTVSAEDEPYDTKTESERFV